MGNEKENTSDDDELELLFDDGDPDEIVIVDKNGKRISPADLPSGTYETYQQMKRALEAKDSWMNALATPGLSPTSHEALTGFSPDEVAQVKAHVQKWQVTQPFLEGRISQEVLRQINRDAESNSVMAKLRDTLSQELNQVARTLFWERISRSPL